MFCKRKSELCMFSYLHKSAYVIFHVVWSRTNNFELERKYEEEKKRIHAEGQRSLRAEVCMNNFKNGKCLMRQMG